MAPLWSTSSEILQEQTEGAVRSVINMAGQAGLRQKVAHSLLRRMLSTLLIILLGGSLWAFSIRIRDTQQIALILVDNSEATTDRTSIAGSEIVLAIAPLQPQAVRQKTVAYSFPLPDNASDLASREPLLIDVGKLTPVTNLAAAKRNTVAHTVNWGRAIAMATEYPLADGTMLVLLMDEGARAICSVYEVHGRHTRRVFNASYMQGAGASPSLRILPGAGARQAPEILELSLPFGPAHWRWNGHDFALSPIAVSHIPILILMVLQAYGVWMWLTLTGLLQWALVFRYAMRTTTALVVGLCLSLVVAGLGSMAYWIMPLALGAAALSGLIAYMIWPKLLQRTAACLHRLTIWRAGIVLFVAVLTFLGVALITASMETTGWIIGNMAASGLP